MDVQQIGYDEVQGRTFYRDLESRLRALPRVVSVSQAFSVPLGIMTTLDPVIAEGHPVEAGKQPPSVQYHMITPHYFETLRIPLLRGKVFSEADNEKSVRVAVINQTMARKFWPGEDPLGKQFNYKTVSGPTVQVVGVVQDGKYKSLTEDPQPQFFIAAEQAYEPLRTFHVRTSVPPESMAGQIQAQVFALAFSGTRLLTDLFYGVTPSDPLTYAAVAILLLSVVLRFE